MSIEDSSFQSKGRLARFTETCLGEMIVLTIVLVFFCILGTVFTWQTGASEDLKIGSTAVLLGAAWLIWWFRLTAITKQRNNRILDDDRLP